MQMQEISSPDHGTSIPERSLDPPVDFHLQKLKKALYPHRLLLQEQERIAHEVESYNKVLKANASVAKNLRVNLSSGSIEARFYNLFSTPRPCVMETNEEEDFDAGMSWPELLQIEISSENFHQTPAGERGLC